jgi:hypothetical protein
LRIGCGLTAESKFDRFIPAMAEGGGEWGEVEWGLLTRVWRRRQFVWCMTLMIYADLGLPHGSLASFKGREQFIGGGGCGK